MQENEIESLTTNEIKRMLIVSINNDIYVAKCFIDLIIEVRDNSIKETKTFKEINQLLSKYKTKEATQLIINKL